MALQAYIAGIGIRRPRNKYRNVAESYLSHCCLLYTSIERRMVRVFSFRTFLTEECFEMVHYAEPGKKPKWSYFPSEGHPDVVDVYKRQLS